MKKTSVLLISSILLTTTSYSGYANEHQKSPFGMGMNGITAMENNQQMPDQMMMDPNIMDNQAMDNNVTFTPEEHKQEQDEYIEEVIEVEDTAEVTDIDGYMKEANNGNIDAMYNLGLIFTTEGGYTYKEKDSEEEITIENNFKEAFKWYSMAANAGDADSQLELAILYGEGRGVAQNYTESLNWYIKSAEQNNHVAQYNLGVIYSEGKGVKVDNKEAVKWYTLAANNGDSTAQYNLGVIYFQGVEGVSKDIEKSFKWISKAAENGDEDALSMLSQPKFIKHTANWYRKRAENGDIEAQLKTASFYLWGKGFNKDIVRAHMWFNIASVSGNEEALENRKSIEKTMTLEQIEQAQNLATEWHNSKKHVAK